MPATFEEALKATLTNVNEKFEEADADLHRETAAAAQSLLSVTQGAATLKLVKAGETTREVIYALVIPGGITNQTELARFRMPAKGYPIQVVSGPLNSVEASFADKQALADYLAKLASNPDSPLITAAAYLMRKKNDGSTSPPTT